MLGAGIYTSPFDPPAKQLEAANRFRRLYQLAQETGVSHLVDTIPALLVQMDDPSEEVRQRAYGDVLELIGIGYRFRADAPESDRRRVIARYRALWNRWNNPDFNIAEMKRYPEKMRLYKQRWREALEQRREEAGQ